MPLSTRIADDVDAVDVIVCGGGTAGCVVAARLAEADPHLSVLLIERGANNEGKDSVHQPILMPLNLVPDTKTALLYQGKKADAVNGRAITVQTGGILGGGSSINFMLYSRAQGVDFDSWNMPGWSGRDMIPFMTKLENYHGNTDNISTHGKAGPVQISDGGFRGVRSQDDFLDAAAELGYDVRTDMQDPTAVNNGFQEALRYVTPEGRRHDAASAYIHPLLKDGNHPNLHVLCESRVIKVLFDDQKRACGVEYTPDPHTTPAIPDHEPVKLVAHARKLVILSSGALGTPLILERSGIGSADVLQRAGIPQVVDLPDVGSNFDDHALMFWPWTTNLGPYDTGDALLSQRISSEEAAAHGMMGWNMIDVHGKLRPTDDEAAVLGPEFQKAWDRDYKNHPKRPLMLSATACFFGDPSVVPPGAHFAIASYTAYSHSRGYIHITGADVQDPIDFDPGFLSDPDGLDVKMHMWHYKKLRQIMRSTTMYTGELALGHPHFPEGSAAAIKTDTNAASVDANPEYSGEDDAAIEQYIRNNVATTWHSAGTAKMSPRENQGVVDEKLDVYGVSRLKCIDLSIMPTMVAANTNNTAYVIGEKGADIILRELGLA